MIELYAFVAWLSTLVIVACIVVFALYIIRRIHRADHDLLCRLNDDAAYFLRIQRETIRDLHKMNDKVNCIIKDLKKDL